MLLRTICVSSLTFDCHRRRKLEPTERQASDPGIQLNIDAAVSKYVVSGPAVIAGGTTVTPGDPTYKNAKMIRGINYILEY
jgi:cellulase